MTRTHRRFLPPSDVRFLLAATTVGISLCLTSCGKLRSPEELLKGPDSAETDRAMAKAKGLFQRNCSICHGETGTGDGQYFASDLKPAPSDLTRRGADTLHASDLERWIREGSTGFGRSALCPPWGYTFTEDDIVILAEFILSLRKPERTPGEDEK